jgi:hypothetical protein
MRNDLRHINHEGTILNLNDKDRYALTESPGAVRGIYGVPTEPVFATIPRKLPVGIYQANNMIMRGIEFTLTIRGCNAAQVADNIHTLWDHLWVDVRDDEQGTLEYESWNYNLRQITCAVMAGSEGIDEWMGQLVNFESAARATLNFSCADPTFMDDEDDSANGAFAGVGNVNIACNNLGNADAYPTIVYDTGAVNVLSEPQVTDDYGSVLKIDSTSDVAINTTLTLVSNPQNMSITYSGAPANWFGRRESAGVMPLLRPGNHNLVFTATNAAANATITVTWRNRWASHG